MNTLEQKIWSLIEAGVEDLKLRLVRVRISGGDYAVTLQIMVEPQSSTPENQVGAAMGDITEVTRMISALMDVEDLFPDAYTMEVSSPGVARPLVTARDFEVYGGYRIKVELTEVLNERRRYSGTLLGMDEAKQNILLKEETLDEKVELPLELLKKSKLAYTQDEMSQILKDKLKNSKSA
jgi:ribosome maturation factor RimP